MKERDTRGDESGKREEKGAWWAEDDIYKRFRMCLVLRLGFKSVSIEFVCDTKHANVFVTGRYYNKTNRYGETDVTRFCTVQVQPRQSEHVCLE